MDYIRKLIFAFAMIMVVSCCYGQTFSEYLNSLPIKSVPKKFNQGSEIEHEKIPLLPNLFTDSIFNLDRDRAYLRLDLDANFPIILIGQLSNDEDYFELAGAASFDTSGNYLDFLALFHTADGEGSTYSITPENKIRVASYGASEAVIWTYRYENGQFIREVEPEYGDVDNLPDY